jgi:apolipoprotein N-acyltransferase
LKTSTQRSALTCAPRTATLFSAFLIVCAHPPLEWHVFIWVGVVPWLLTVQRCRSWKEAAVQGFWLNVLLGFGGAFSVAFAVPRYLGVSPAFGVVAMVLHACAHQLQFVAFAPLFHWMSNRERKPLGLMHLLLAAFLYTGLDWIVPNLFQDTFGFVLHNYPRVSQMAEFGGTPLLTFVVLVVNLCLFSLVQMRPGSAKPFAATEVLSRFALLGLVFAVCLGFGTLRYEQLNTAIGAASKRVRVGVVQGNVSDELKTRWAAGDPEAAKEALTIYIRASHELLESNNRPEVIVWPETAYPGIFRRPENEEQGQINVAMDKYVGTNGTPFVFGAYDREDRTDRRVLRNAIFFVEPKPGQSVRELSPMQVYHKHILFPVGEYLPFVDEKFMQRWLPGAATFSAGEGPAVYEVTTARGSRLRLGPSICYEDLFPSHPIALARLGAEVIVNVSNDSWFGNYGLPQFHLIAAKLRSIETRLVQVRATNTGYSALILPTGDLGQPTDYGKRRSMNVSVPVIERIETPMIRWGDWFGGASLILGLLGLLLVRRHAAEP